LPYNPARRTGRFGLLPFRSPLLGKSSLFLRVLRCFSSPGSLPETMCSSQDTWAFPHVGFPIRTSLAQAGAHPLPELSAVYHVLHRQLTPRHPPYALSSLSLHVIRRNGCSRVTFAYALVKVPGNRCRPVPRMSPSAPPLDRASQHNGPTSAGPLPVLRSTSVCLPIQFAVVTHYCQSRLALVSRCLAVALVYRTPASPSSLFSRRLTTAWRRGDSNP
jgi:hypothetical protein